ncbi:mediator of RNA polymerase II transcription subunit 18 isoform X2 [Folsomia candida]|uniref:Mediator of RNA polymerase II transcription subunit 18 n=2 Tax=Folsomia candida TaxID=158441 RepID=A0A226EKS9_FOLCA|nr:mediator of RNA polymerase II transcription subunit 18 isoform X2 [Folsomia candida]XP_035705434.1 mediator of RNA polymerase II transcription subunit 18 isoform X2 [Folsomia candida]OXA57818.1 Mediator of RNA polymerase II transcription subunit 18 [Folsomia candida]
MDSLEPSAKQQELQSLSALDTLTSAMKSNIIPNQEYLLQGSIFDNSVDVLLHRLRGLCDNVDSGPETFHDHEACFVLYGNPGTGQQPPPLTLRVRRALDDTSAPWHLRYMGQAEIGDKNRPTMIRSTLDVAVGSDILEFLKELGCRREFDFITKGFLFRKGRLKIIVGKVYRYESGKSSQELEPVTQSHYVEMSVVAPTGQDTVGDDMKTLAEQLKPLIFLKKEK